MAYLTPDNIRIFCGVVIKEKIIPDNAVWQKNSGRFTKGSPYKSGRLLSDGTGKVQYITIHNTGRISHSPQTTASEQYTRATWPNCNMNDVRVHYYVDGTEAWQNLKENEVGWHSGDGNTGPGNSTTIAIECIMNGSHDDEDIQSEDNCARLAAGLLLKYGLTYNELVSHYKWAELKGGYKYCPAYILGHWSEFKLRVKNYMEEFSAANSDVQQSQPEPVIQQNPEPEIQQQNESINVSDTVLIKQDADEYWPGGPHIPDWVKASYTHIVTQTEFRGKAVIKGGARCVLLGKKISVSSSQVSPGINTWIDISLLKKI